MEDFFSLETRRLLEKLIDYGISALEAIAILVIGFWLSRYLSRYIYLLMAKKEVDASIRNFIKDFIQIFLNVLVVIIAISTIGISVTSILAIIGGAALGVGVGLQGSISNFAGGVMIILTKPFKSGDLIESGSHIGYVEKISLLNTTIRSPRNEIIIIPNAPLFSNPLSNFSTKDSFRIDIVAGVEVSADVHKLKPLIKEAIKKDELFFADKPIVVEIEQFAQDRLNLTIRTFSKPKYYWDAPLRLHQIVKDTIEENGYKIPVAQIQITNKNSDEDTKWN